MKDRIVWDDGQETFYFDTAAMQHISKKEELIESKQ